MINFKKKSVRVAGISLIVLSTIFTGCTSNDNNENTSKNEVEQNVADTKEVVDIVGRTVTVPTNPQRIAAIVGPGYEKIFMLGAADRIVIKSGMTGERPWGLKTNPNLAKIAVLENPQDPNVEELVNLDVDLAFFWGTEDPIRKMESVGIPAVATQESETSPENLDEFIEYQKKEVRVFANALGEDAQKKAEKWCDYFDEQIEYVTSRTSKLKESEIKKVYYARSDDALKCFSRNSTPQYLVELAGGVSVAKDTKDTVNALVTLEQIIEWDPDVIFMGRMNSTDAVLKDERWADIAAVKNKEVYLSPNGVMYWDYSSEGALLLPYIASKLHPELFKDLDMIKETKEYYKDFYSYDLSDEDAERILNHLDPL